MTLAEPGAAYRSELAVVRRMTAADARWAAALHQRALSHGFFARLGRRFLAAYYESFVVSPFAVAFIAETSEGPAGMLVGTVRNRAHYSWVMRNRRRRLLWAGIRALLFSPPALMFFLRTRVGWYTGGVLRFSRRAFLRRVRRPGPAGVVRRGPAVLTHVAVASDARGTGAGSALVRVFEDAARGAECDEALLVTLAGPAGAGQFYRRLGWTLHDRHTDHDGRLLECYQRRL
jgi:GNAT superfamily N-acetyltransferase